MKPQPQNGYARKPSAARAPTPTTPTPQPAAPTPDGVMTIADHEVAAQLRRFGERLQQNDPAMASFLDEHAGELRSMMTAAINGAVQSERRRLTWLLHNDLADVLAAARERVSALTRASADATLGEALRGIDVCLNAAAKSTRGLIADLKPPGADTE